MGRRALLVLSIVAILVGAPVSPASAVSGASVNSPGTPLNVRTGASTAFGKIGSLRHGTPVTPVCQVAGQMISGTERRTNMWDQLSTGGYVSDAYIRRSAPVPRCGNAWVHPLPGFRVQGGFRTPARPTHIGVDLMSYYGTQVRAASAGRVLEAACNIHPGGSCNVTGSPAARGCGWYVKIAHSDRIATLYCHLWWPPYVVPGQHVVAGQVIGLVGSSGRSSYPHLHFEVHINAPPTGPANAIDPRPFMAVRGAPLG